MLESLERSDNSMQVYFRSGTSQDTFMYLFLRKTGELLKEELVHESAAFPRKVDTHLHFHTLLGYGVLDLVNNLRRSS
ncbi:hypothetical protein KA005_35640, partial [bacterium]|nr:hypothetical protein [bacterium]